MASLAAPATPELKALLGPPAAAALHDELVARARRWVAAVAPGRAFEATSTLMAGAALRDHAGPVLLVAPDVPALGAAHAADALDDLADGVAIVLAPTSDGSPFLLGLPRPDPALLELAGQGFEVLAGSAAVRAGGFGLLRAERRLASRADALALAADPVAPEALVGHLRHAVAVRRPAPAA